MSQQGKNNALLKKVNKGDINAVQQLLSEGADVNYINYQGEFAFYTTCSNGDADMTTLLLKNIAQIGIKSNGVSSLTIASYENHIAVVKLLLKNNANVDLQMNDGISALHIASEKGHDEVLKLLLENGAKIDLQRNSGASALFIASQNGHVEVVKSLLKNGAKINLQKNDGASALYIASRRGHDEVVKLLLENGAKVDLQRNSGESALYIASEKGHDEVVKLLLENRVKVDSQKNNGTSSLFIASQKGHDEVVKLLLKNGAKVDLQRISGASALYIASQNGNVKVSKLLLEYGAKIDIQKNDGYSPLMIACKHGLIDVTQVLLDHDADTYLRNNKGQTALEIAKEKNHVDIISLFADLKEKAAYPGILFSEGVKKESITSDEKTVNLEEVGISLTFPENSLPSKKPPVEVAIEPCFSGPFIMPDGIESTSPAYVIKTNQKVKFEKYIVLKIQHNANLQTEEDCESMVFLSASSTPEYRGSTPVYVFKEITDTKGLFRPGQEKPLGEIQLNHFSIITTGIKLLKRIGSKKGAKGIVSFFVIVKN